MINEPCIRVSIEAELTHGSHCECVCEWRTDVSLWGVWISCSTAWHSLYVSMIVFSDFSPVCVYYCLYVYVYCVPPPPLHHPYPGFMWQPGWEAKTRWLGEKDYLYLLGLLFSPPGSVTSHYFCPPARIVWLKRDTFKVRAAWASKNTRFRGRVICVPFAWEAFFSVSGQVNFSQSWHWWQLSLHLFKWNGWLHLGERRAQRGVAVCCCDCLIRKDCPS